jgi:hypothetical protein
LQQFLKPQLSQKSLQQWHESSTPKQMKKATTFQISFKKIERHHGGRPLITARADFGCHRCHPIPIGQYDTFHHIAKHIIINDSCSSPMMIAYFRTGMGGALCRKVGLGV